MTVYNALLAVLICVMTAISAQAQETQPELQAGPRTESDISALPWLRLDSLDVTRKRPVFAPDRRPPAPPPKPAVQITPPPAPKVIPTLRGIIVEPTATLVLLQDQATSEAVVVRAGDKFGRWLVTVRSNHSVELSSDGERINLDLFED